MSNVQSLERALTILNTLSDHPDGLPIAKLTKLVDLSKVRLTGCWQRLWT